MIFTLYMRINDYNLKWVSINDYDMYGSFLNVKNGIKIRVAVMGLM